MESVSLSRCLRLSRELESKEKKFIARVRDEGAFERACVACVHTSACHAQGLVRILTGPSERIARIPQAVSRQKDHRLNGLPFLDYWA